MGGREAPYSVITYLNTRVHQERRQALVASDAQEHRVWQLGFVRRRSGGFGISTPLGVRWGVAYRWWFFGWSDRSTWQRCAIGSSS